MHPSMRGVLEAEEQMELTKNCSWARRAEVPRMELEGDPF